MRCPECSTEMWPIIVPHHSGVWLWECPRCGVRYDIRTAETILKEVVICAHDEEVNQRGMGGPPAAAPESKEEDNA